MTAGAQAKADEPDLGQGKAPLANSADALNMMRALVVQRDGDFLIRLASTAPFSHDLPLEIRLLHADFGHTILHLRDLPQISGSGAFKTVADHLPPGATRALRRRRHRMDLRFPAPTMSSPIVSVQPTFVTPEGVRKVEWLTDQVGLECRIPLDKSAFRDHLSFRQGRHLDAETVMWACRDILSLHLGDAERDAEINPYLSNAFVIFLYKAIECGDDGQSLFVQETCDTILSIASTISERSSIKENPHQAIISNHTALWHYWAAQGDGSRMLFHLERLAEAHRSFRGRKKLSHAFNVCLSLCLLGAVRANTGDLADARRCFRDVYDAYRQAIAIGTMKLSPFQELRVSHETTELALEGLEQLEKSGAIKASLSDRIVQHCPRVKTPAFLDILRTQVAPARSEPDHGQDNRTDQTGVAALHKAAQGS